MFEPFLASLFSHAPLLVFVAAILDVFFVTGLLFYGVATLSSVAMLYFTGMISLEAIVISSFSGTVLGNTVNYGAGRFFGTTATVTQFLQRPRLKTAHVFLQTRGLFLFIAVCRFIALFRPVYALLLGSMRISFGRFLLYESIVALAWVIFWLGLLIEGKALYSTAFGG